MFGSFIRGRTRCQRVRSTVKLINVSGLGDDGELRQQAFATPFGCERLATCWDHEDMLTRVLPQLE